MHSSKLNSLPLFPLTTPITKKKDAAVKSKKKNQETLFFQHGNARIFIAKNGTIRFENSHAAIELQANGTININGAVIEQTSEQNTYINAKQHIHLNSPSKSKLTIQKSSDLCYNPLASHSQLDCNYEEKTSS